MIYSHIHKAFIVFSLFLISLNTYGMYSCDSIEKNVDKTPKYIIEFYKKMERPNKNNPYPNILFYETSGVTTQSRFYNSYNISKPVVFQLCREKIYGLYLTVICDSTIGNSVILNINLQNNTGSFEDGSLKLYNMTCQRL